MRWNKLMRLSATLILLHRVLVAAVHETCKAASGGATRLRDQSLWFREAIFCHRRGSRVTYRRSDRYRPISIISLPFSLEFGLRRSQHPWRWRGSGRPPRCWWNTFGAQFSFLTTWDTTVVPGTPSSMTRSAKSLTGVHHGICLGN